ncbi:hypothetical protein K438DRAFT_1800098 [Mycena galopus ATCC 62051]|nr:hypothetical protein K438DRAFT_1800098 [Mycena galopus ATCC 62051]
MVSVTPNLLWRLGSSYAAAGIITGAFGAHGLKSRGTSADSIASFQTASHYAVFNGLALLLLSLHPRFRPIVSRAPLVWALVLNRERFRFLGPVTPMGGMLMIAG